MNAELTKQLRRDEGVEKSAYQDSLGYWTIGVGRLIDKRKGGGLSDDEMDYLLQNDIKEKTLELKSRVKCFDKLSEPRKGVLINMAFNLGTNGLLNFKKTMALIEAGDYEAASKEMLNSTWAKQVGARATRLSEQLKTNTWR